jgi:L-alanine-DL-glutamate epimerase-like enolase superfamily enzyme
VQPDIVEMDGIGGLIQCAWLCRAHGVQLAPHQTQPTIGHAANMHLMGTVMHLAKSVEVTDNRRRLNALFKNAPKPQIGAFPVSSGPGLGLELEKLEPRIKPL